MIHSYSVVKMCSTQAASGLCECMSWRRLNMRSLLPLLWSPGLKLYTGSLTNTAANSLETHSTSVQAGYINHASGVNNVDFGQQHRLRAAALLLGLSFCSRFYATVQKKERKKFLLGYVEVPLTAGRLFADRAGLFVIALINHGRVRLTGGVRRSSQKCRHQYFTVCLKLGWWILTHPNQGWQLQSSWAGFKPGFASTRVEDRKPGVTRCSRTGAAIPGLLNFTWVFFPVFSSLLLFFAPGSASLVFHPSFSPCLYLSTSISHLSTSSCWRAGQGLSQRSVTLYCCEWITEPPLD